MRSGSIFCSAGLRTASPPFEKSNLTPFLALLSLAVLVSLPACALDRTQLAIVVNTLDPLSVNIGDYYAARRKISFQNVIRVSFPPRKTVLAREEFDAIKAQVDRQTLPK